MEAFACGTPIVTFDVSGNPEIINSSCGLSVPPDDIDALETSVKEIQKENLFPVSTCVRREGQFDEKARYREYVNLYAKLAVTER